MVSVFFIFLFCFLLFADVLTFIPLITYWDELFAIAIPVYTLFYKILCRRFSLNKNKAKMLVALFIVFVFGIFGNIFSPSIQSNKVAIYKDVLQYLKFPILMITLMYSRISSEVNRNIISKISYVAKANIIVASIMAFVGYFVNIGVYTDEIRYVKCFRYIFRHPTFAVANFVFCVAILFLENKKKNTIFIILSCVLLFLTQRTKAYAIIIVIIGFMLISERQLINFISFDFKTKLKLRKVLPIVVVLATCLYFVFIEKFNIYMRWGMTSARIALYITSIFIGRDYFPFGTGFGTYASSLSGKYYSNIYEMYKLSQISGLTADNYNYISDTFWPWIIGEFGFIALFIYLYLFFQFIKNQFSKLKSPSKVRAFIILWSYALLASFMEAFFSNTTSVALALLLTIYIGTDR